MSKTENPQLNFERYFDLSPDLLCIAGFDGYFRRVNPAVSKLLGYSMEELLARPIHEFIFPEDRERTASNRQNILQGTPLLNFENRYVTKGGEVVWLSWTSMPVDSDQIVYAIAKDVTHRKKFEEDRNRIITQLTQKNKELKLLTFKTSHDLRSPVNNLLAVFSLIDVTSIQDQETLQFMHLLKLSAERLKTTLNEFVEALQHKESLQVEVEELNLTDTVEKVTLSLQSLLETSRASLHINFAEAEQVFFNKAYLESIFLNLITNSIKYARLGLAPEITITSRLAAGQVLLTFADKGLGFDMEKVKDRIFGFHQKFHDHDDSKGIGLYLVYNHITSLGGRIEVESAVNQGTTFTISFKKPVAKRVLSFQAYNDAI
ncbi:MAG: PAS domain S-box protein [Adhaeribacter sp.]